METIYSQHWLLLKLLSKELFVVSQIELYQTSWQYPLINYLGSGRFGFLNWFEFACPLELTTLILCRPFSNLIFCSSHVFHEPWIYESTKHFHETSCFNFSRAAVSFSVIINIYIGIIHLNRKLLSCRKTKQRKFDEKTHRFRNRENIWARP